MDAMANPAEAVKGIAEKIQQDVKESGMDAAEKFVDELEELKEKAKKGPGDLLDKAKAVMESFKKKLEDALADPASLAPGSGALTAVASWYGNAVVGKLKDLAKEFEELFEAMKSAASDMTGPFKNVGETMGKAMEGINKTVKNLMDLPKQILALSDTVRGADDLKNVDTSGMKSRLDTSGLSQPLDDLVGLKDTMGPMVGKLKAGMERVSSFVGSAPETIKGAFAVPMPLCFMTSCAMDQAPPIMKELLDKVEALGKFDFQPILDMLTRMAENLGKLDVSKVKDPVVKFAEAAKGNVDSLDTVVNAAKMANAVPSMPAGAPKLW